MPLPEWQGEINGTEMRHWQAARESSVTRLEYPVKDGETFLPKEIRKRAASGRGSHEYGTDDIREIAVSGKKARLSPFHWLRLRRLGEGEKAVALVQKMGGQVITQFGANH